MATPSFYHPLLAQADSVIELEQGEAAHAVKARRLRVGDAVRIFSGGGLSAMGVLESVERRSVSVVINEFQEHKRPAPVISVAVAVPKGDRQKVLVDALTQLGVFEIIPLRCERSVTKSSANTLEKWERVAIEACKQSQNPWIPKISEELCLEELIADNARALCYADATGAPLRELSFEAAKSSCITILVGPEGGYSPEEFNLLDQNSIPSFRLGPYILRTEAAAIAAVSALIA